MYEALLPFLLFLVPEVELKGKTCNYYFLVQGNGCGGCRATLIYSADQINGSVTLTEAVGRLTPKGCETEEGNSVLNNYMEFEYSGRKFAWF